MKSTLITEERDRIVKFGNFLLSKERKEQKLKDGFPVDEVSHADIENFFN